MVDEDCIDVLTQISAIRAALDKIAFGGSATMPAIVWSGGAGGA